MGFLGELAVTEAKHLFIAIFLLLNISMHLELGLSKCKRTSDLSESSNPKGEDTKVNKESNCDLDIKCTLLGVMTGCHGNNEKEYLTQPDLFRIK